MPRPSRQSWIVPVERGLRLAVRLQPGAAKTALGGLVTGADGREMLAARVTAPPEGGRANAALIAALAKTWRLPKGAFEIVSGRAERNKTLLVAGDPAALQAQLGAWMRDRGAAGRRGPER
ncbi:MAG: DUF167 family protein [Kiloniellales bacterium]|nr:DUF167 family protein [Kiloniellales bacterium]